MLKLENFSNSVLKNINLQVNKGDFIVVTGPNGSGKSTLIKSILNLDDLFGETGIKTNNFNNISYIPQQVFELGNGIPFSCKEVIESVSSKIDDQLIKTIACELQVTSLLNKRIDQLSGGEKQKIFLARAMVSNSDLIILDEPNTAIDQKSTVSLYQLLEKINKKGTAIIVITHDYSMLKDSISSKIIKISINEGSIV